MNKALVILSGGQDSTTCLYKALLENDQVFALTFDYGQRHSIEVASARAIAKLAGVYHEVLALPDHILKGTSPLVNRSFDVEQYADVESLPGGVEKTFVPGRNILFLTIAANRAAVHSCNRVYIGVSQEDYGGYPDCRSNFLDFMELALNAGIVREDDGEIAIIAPLIYLTKKQTVELAQSLPGCMEALAFSHTCYNGAAPPCGHCHACLLRSRGFAEAGIDDPLVTRFFKQASCIEAP